MTQPYQPLPSDWSEILLPDFIVMDCNNNGGVRPATAAAEIRVFRRPKLPMKGYCKRLRICVQRAQNTYDFSWQIRWPANRTKCLVVKCEILILNGTAVRFPSHMTVSRTLLQEKSLNET
jgi:hypothetical protein